MTDDSFTAVTIRCPDDTEMLVRTWADGTVDVDLRVGGSFGPRVWTPISILGGSFTVEHCGNRTYTEAEIAAVGERANAFMDALNRDCAS